MAEEEKKRRSKGLMIGLIAFLVWAIGAAIVVIFVIMRPPDFSESPLVSRDIPNYDDDSPVGLLEQLSLPPRSGRLAEEAFLKPVRIDGTESNFVFHWKGEKEIDPETLPERVADGLLGDDEIELFAFATWTPGADDEIEVEIEEEYDHDFDEKLVTVSNGDWKAPLTFRDPKTLEVFSDEKLDELQIPESFRTAAPPQRYKTGLVRLLFRSTNMGPVRFVGGSGGDSVTGGKVTYSLSSLGREADQASVGEWTHYDFALLLWHDKPLKFHVRVLTGEPEYADLRQQLGEQVVLGERVRLQWLAREDGYFSIQTGEYFTPQPGVDHKLLKGIARRASEEEEASIISWDSFPGSTPSLSVPSTLPTPADTSAEPDADADGKTDPDSEEDEKSPVLYRVDNDFAAHIEVSSDSSRTPETDTHFRISDQKYVDHLGRINEDGKVSWEFDSNGKSEAIHFASCKQTKTPVEPLRLVFLPHLAELTFEIAGTPDVPNPGDIEDLFDQKIPRLTLSDTDPEGAETELMQFIAVATQSGIDHTDLWEDSWPSSMPRDRTFRDTTPQLLLNWYLQATPDAFIVHDTDRLLLLSNQDEESFWDKVVNFFDGLF